MKPTGAPVNKEAFRMLATEVGLNEAARRLGVPIPTAKAWARRGGWKLPKRKGGRPQRSLPASSSSSLHPIADALDASREELLDTASTAILQAIAKTATEAAKKGALTVATVSELSQLANALARARGDQSQVNVAVSNKVGVIVTPEKLEQLRERFRRLQEEQEQEEKALPAKAGPNDPPRVTNAARGQCRRGEQPLWRAYHSASVEFAEYASARLRSCHT
jgi:hypothetical protein